MIVDADVSITSLDAFDISYYRERLSTEHYDVDISNVSDGEFAGTFIEIGRNGEVAITLQGDLITKQLWTAFVRTSSVRDPSGYTVGQLLSKALGGQAQCEVGDEGQTYCWKDNNPSILYMPDLRCKEKIKDGDNVIADNCRIAEIAVIFNK